MNDRDLTALFRKELDEMGFCDKFKEFWRDDFTRRELVGQYKRGIEYCIDHDWPKNDFIKKYFDKEFLKEEGVFVDDDFGKMEVKDGVYIFNGASSGKVTLKGFTAATMYIRHACDITILAKDMSRLFIEVYDNAFVSITQSGNASVYVYNRSEKSKIECFGNVMVKQ